MSNWRSKLGVVVSWSSNEAQFLKPQLREILVFADHVVYSIGTRLYDMRPEILPRVPDKVSIARYEVSSDVVERPRKYHNLAREVGVSALPDDAKWVLFLDADEIPDGAMFKAWFDEMEKHLFKGLAYKFACHWYFVRPTWRAVNLEDSIVLVHRDQLTPAALADEGERDGIVRRCPGGCMRSLKNKEDLPMFHHFSWVRSKEQMLHKVQTWGHRKDREDWSTLVHRVWTADAPPADGDFVHGYTYDIVEDRFDISL